MKRLCVYLTYDKQNIVDAYIGYMLKELKTCVEYLAVVCNESEIVRGTEILKKYADKIYCRENIGYDAGGFKDALCRFIGWERVLSFDELVLVNDSFFGPFRPMTEVFDEMAKCPADFWGLSKHGKYTTEDMIEYPEHLQSFFLVVRKKMLHEGAFQEYWENMPYYKTYDEVVKGHEIRFTNYFAGLGFSFDCLADMAPNDSSKSRNNFNQYGLLSYELIKKRNFPFLKKQPLAWNTLRYQTQENLKQSLEYIEKETAYDVNLIWENIIRTFDINDLQHALHLQYIVPSSVKEAEKLQEALVCVFVNYKESEEYVLEYLENIRGFCEIKIYSQKLELLNPYMTLGYQCVFFNGSDGYRDILKELGEWEIVCVLHDMDVTGKQNPSYSGKSSFFQVWENLLKDASHVSWIAETFEKEQKLGFLVPPRASFGKHFGSMGIKWGGDFQKYRDIAEGMQLCCQMSQNKFPFSVSDAFWIRGCILKNAYEKGAYCAEALSCLWGYIAQDAGFYSGIVESTDYASMNAVNLQYYLDMTTVQIRNRCGDFDDFVGMLRKIPQSIIEAFCKNVEHIYIYGTGAVARRYREMIPDIEAYIVSDGQPKEDMIDEVRVIYLSQLTVQDNAGIIICMGKKNQRQVVSLLEEKGWHNYLCI